MNRLREPAIAFSLANLCYFPVWREILPGAPLLYFLRDAPTHATLLTAIAGVFILSLLFWGAALSARHAGGVWVQAVRLLFMAVVLSALNSFRKQAPPVALRALLPSIGATVWLVIGAIGAVLALAASLKWWTQIVRFTAAVTLLFFPFAVLTLGRAAWAVINHERSYADLADGPYAARSNAESSARGRVVWIVFDELDYRIAFERRPPGLALPEVDRFAAESLHASHAYPPSGETFLSIPALLTGKHLLRGEPQGPREMNMVVAESPHEEELRDGSPTIFSAWRKAGGNAAAVGMCHPYCRLFNEDLIDCAWVTDYAGQTRKHVPGLGVAETAMIHVADVLGGFPLMTNLGVRRSLINRTGGARAKRQALGVARFERLLSESKRMLEANEADLLYLHLSVPHVPFIYDREKGVLVDNGRRSYADNLALMDKTLGEFRRIMEAKGTWDTSTVLVTSDHWFRFNLWKPWKSDNENVQLGKETDMRVPLMLKLPQQREGIVYERPFSTTPISSLLMALGSDVRTPQDAARWLDEHAPMAKPSCGRNSGCKGPGPVVPPPAG